MNDDWDGPPKVTATEEAEDYEFFLVPTVLGQDFGIQLEGSHDLFYPVFTNEVTLNEYMVHFSKKLGMELAGSWAVQRIEGMAMEALFEVLQEKGARMMIDPVAVSEHHTTWRERVKVGDLWKYQDFESN